MREGRQNRTADPVTTLKKTQLERRMTTTIINAEGLHVSMSKITDVKYFP